MPETGLGAGRVEGWGIKREWLAWHNEAGQPYPLPHQMIRRLNLEVEQALSENQRLREKLRELGIDPDAVN